MCGLMNNNHYFNFSLLPSGWCFAGTLLRAASSSGGRNALLTVEQREGVWLLTIGLQG
jgi:hypothetical protein